MFVNLMGKSLSIKHTVAHQERNPKKKKKKKRKENGLEGARKRATKHTHGRDLSRFHDPSCSAAD